MVGNEADARLALEGKGVLTNIHPDGMAGYRRVHVIDGVVYKIANGPKRYGESYLDCNFEEFQNYIRLTECSALPPHIRLPRMELFRIDETYVIAAEFIPGRHLSVDEFLAFEDDLQDITGLIDLHEENVKIHDGVYYLIDVDK